MTDRPRVVSPVTNRPQRYEMDVAGIRMLLAWAVREGARVQYAAVAPLLPEGTTVDMLDNEQIAKVADAVHLSVDRSVMAGEHNPKPSLLVAPDGSTLVQ